MAYLTYQPTVAYRPTSGTSNTSWWLRSPYTYAPRYYNQYVSYSFDPVRLDGDSNEDEFDKMSDEEFDTALTDLLLGEKAKPVGKNE